MSVPVYPPSCCLSRSPLCWRWRWVIASRSGEFACRSNTGGFGSSSDVVLESDFSPWGPARSAVAPGPCVRLAGEWAAARRASRHRPAGTKVCCSMPISVQLALEVWGEPRGLPLCIHSGVRSALMLGCIDRKGILLRDHSQGVQRPCRLASAQGAGRSCAPTSFLSALAGLYCMRTGLPSKGGTCWTGRRACLSP